MSRNVLLRSSTWAFLALGIASLANAGPGPAPGIVGSWEFRNERGAVRFVFDANGSGSMDKVPFQWVFEDGELEITMQGNTVSYRAAIVDGELHLSAGDLAAEVTLKRSQGQSVPDTRIQGKWQAANGSVVEFRPDGTGSNWRGNFRYTASDGALAFDDGTGGLLVTYEIHENELLLSSNGDRAFFARVRDGIPVATSSGPASGKRSVIVNRTQLVETEIGKFEAQFQIRMLDGKYWYDATCGAWGLEGGPCRGFLPAKLVLGGPLRPDASGGGTGVFVNGRELHPMDVAALQRLTAVQPGRYWVDAIGNCGYEGNPIPIVNLAQLASAARSASGGSYISRSNITGIGTGGDGHTSYVMGKDWSVVIGE